MKLIVSIEINGVSQIAGEIDYNTSDDARFRYSDEYVKNKMPAISISLPIQYEYFSTTVTRNFFDGLLPEGFTRFSVAGHIRAAENDYISILKVLGQECIGAIRIYEENAPEPDSGYRPVDYETIAALAAEGAGTTAKMMADIRLSLAGASGKVGLAYDGRNWYLPVGLAPSTHIVKQSHVRLEHIVVNECLVMRAAAILGLNVSSCFIIKLKNGEDSDVLFASERFDREYVRPLFNGNAFAPIARLHQEDFAQILGINSAIKYEPAGGHYLNDMFDVIRAYSSNPVADSEELWKRIIFDYFVGNADCHVKNFSMLYSADLKSMRLSPLYDALSTKIYNSTSKSFAFNIAGKYRIGEMSRDDFAAAGKEAGLGEKYAIRIFDQIADEYKNAVKTAAKELADEGFANAEIIAERIIQST